MVSSYENSKKYIECNGILQTGIKQWEMCDLRRTKRKARNAFTHERPTVEQKAKEKESIGLID